MKSAREWVDSSLWLEVFTGQRKTDAIEELVRQIQRDAIEAALRVTQKEADDWYPDPDCNPAQIAADEIRALIPKEPA